MTESLEPQSWSFNQPVLLNKSKRPSSVLVWTLVGTTVFAAGWAFIAPLPETIAVKGKLQPISPIQDIEAPLPGVVSHVDVVEGQVVQKGDILLRFSSKEIQARLDAAKVNRNALLNKVAINQAILGDRSTIALSINQKKLLLDRRQEEANILRADEAALERNRVRIEGLRKTLAQTELIAERYAQLLRDGAASELQTLEVQSRVDRARTDLEFELREQKRLRASTTSGDATRRAQRRREIEDLLQRIADYERDIQTNQTLLEKVVVKSPTNGIVFNLSVYPGSLVEANEARPLLKVIPQNNLEAKVYIPNSAIGFVQNGQKAAISLNSFKASDFAYLPASVKRIGSDALTPEEQQRVLGQGAEGLFFPATLQLSHQTLNVGERSIPLQPGMSLTADLHLRNRRFISAITDFFDDKRRGLERLQ